LACRLLENTVLERSQDGVKLEQVRPSPGCTQHACERVFWEPVSPSTLTHAGPSQACWPVH
jgi:hypothetical protein